MGRFSIGSHLEQFGSDAPRTHLSGTKLVSGPLYLVDQPNDIECLKTFTKTNLFQAISITQEIMTGSSEAKHQIFDQKKTPIKN